MPRIRPDMTIQKLDLDDILKIAEDPEKQYTYNPADKPPPFGHAMKKLWGFDPDYVNLNHGQLNMFTLPMGRWAHLRNEYYGH